MRHTRKFSLCPEVILILVAMLIGPALLCLGPERNHESDAQRATVTLSVGDTRGSGVIVIRGGHSYIWTVAHLIVDAESDSGYDPVTVTRNISEKGKTVGKITLTASVIECDTDADLALLELDSNYLCNRGVVFAKGLPKLTEPLFHFGSPFGERGEDFFSRGAMSKIGFKMEDNWMDLVTITASPGCSGGGVFNERGLCVGLVSRQTASTVCFIIPARKIAEWAVKHNVSWAFDK